MGFWGIEVKPGKPHPYHSDNVPGKLHVTQATLGPGSFEEKTVLQCCIGHKSPIYLCTLLPNKTESCPLTLEFGEEELVAFSVIGPQSIHLSGYFAPDEEDTIRDEYDSDSYGEDIVGTESDDSEEYDSEQDYDDFINNGDDLNMYPPSPVRNNGVVIEEIVDDESPENGSQSKQGKKKSKSKETDIVVKEDAYSVSIVESEDEDGFPNSASEKIKSDEKKDDGDTDEDGFPNSASDKIKLDEKADGDANRVTGKKRKAKLTDQNAQLESGEKKKKKKKEKSKKEKANEAKKVDENNEHSVEEPNPEQLEEEKSPEQNNKSLGNGEGVTTDNVTEKKKKKKKNKKNKNQEVEGAKNTDKAMSDAVEEEEKSSHVRNYPNGLVIEELAMGKPDGKRASPGKQVSVCYIGKLQKNGKIFDSNVGQKPFKFRLGLGQVIKGWDVGVNGMRIGDKRRLTIPPIMGYGQNGAGHGVIPPNAWLVFEVELKDVR